MQSAAEPVVFLRDRILPASEAQLKIYDLGIILGATITEMVRTFRHRLFRLDDHIARYIESARYARIGPFPTAARIREISEELVARNTAFLSPGGDLGVVYFATAGESAIYAGAPVASGPTFVVHSFPLPFELWRPYFSEGIHLVTPATRHIPPECLDPKVKNRSRLHWWIAEREAKLAGEHVVPVLLDLDGNLTETAGANLLLVKNGAVLSPKPRNILRGVSRQVVRELCQGFGIPFEEADLQVHDAVNADEMFLATTPYAIAPVTRFNGIEIPRGPVYEQLLEGFSKEAGLDIRAQLTGE